MYLFGIYAVVLTIAVLGSKYGRLPRHPISLRQASALAGLSVVAFLVAINAGFVFDRTFTPLKNYAFHSETFQAIQRIPVLRAIPLPLPYPYLQGFDWVSSNNKSGVTFGNIVLLNRVRGPKLHRSNGFPSYFLIAWLVKEPIGMQILLLVGLVWIFRNRSSEELLAGEGLLMATAVVVFAAFSFLSRAQVGIRHVLPALVIFTVLSGAAFQGWKTFSRRRKSLLAGSVIYAAISVASYFPFMISYFNEIVFDRKMAYRVLADSNLEWGQDDWAVRRYLNRHPGVVLDPPKRVPGRVLVSANLAAGVFPREADYFVRREGLRPAGQAGYGHVLFDVPEATEAHRFVGPLGVSWIKPGGIVPLYSATGTIQPGEWVSIYGANLGGPALTWNGDFPTSLGGASVTIDNKPAFLWFVSPGQINLQAPDSRTTGM